VLLRGELGKQEETCTFRPSACIYARNSTSLHVTECISHNLGFRGPISRSGIKISSKTTFASSSFSVSRVAVTTFKHVGRSKISKESDVSGLIPSFCIFINGGPQSVGLKLDLGFNPRKYIFPLTYEAPNGSFKSFSGF
jgi:hypothetical protein